MQELPSLYLLSTTYLFFYVPNITKNQKKKEILEGRDVSLVALVR
jgi:hypothetical protein